jgi:hypothetical protein
VVLWQVIDDGTNPDWLAYSALPQTVIFSDDMEAAVGNWVANIAGDGRVWTRATNLAHSGDYAFSTSPSGSYGGYPGEYFDGDDLWLVTNHPLDLSNVDSATLTFWTRYRLFSCDDYGFVDVSTDGGSTWDRLNDLVSDHCGGSEPDESSYARYTSNSEDLPGDINGWVKKTLDLSAYTGAGMNNVKIRFYFERDNDPTKRRNGWWIDDVRITTRSLRYADGSPAFPQNMGTLMLRVFEAAVIEFSGGGPTPIAAGDKVFQSNGAIGTVIVPPVLSDTDWAGGNAAGMLWLNNLGDTAFVTGSLDVLGKGTNLATVTDYTERTNLIKAYYNNLVQTGSVYDDGYDQQRLENNAGTLHWPADEGQPTTGGNDYFTLLEWDADINPAVSTIRRLKDNNGRYTILASDESDLFTPADTYFPFNRPELGLHALGHGFDRVYFDDVGVQLYLSSGSGFLTPIQQ